MRRVAGFLLVTSLLMAVSGRADAAPPDLVVGIWPQNLAQVGAIQTASGISIPYFRGRMRDGQFDTKLAPPDDLAASAAGYSIGMNIQPKTGSGAMRTGILYTDISAQIEAASGPYYDKLVSMANEVLALPTYGVVPNYLEFHSEANIQAAPGVPSPHPYSGTGPEYQQCYALIHQLFDSLGVTNKIYWQIVLTHSAYIGLQGGPQNWYPNDPSLYDLVGADAYYQSPGWLSPSSAFDDAFAWAQAQGKPVWIDETGADEGGSSGSATAKAEWLGALGSYLEAHRRSLAGVVFSHSSDDGNWFLDSVLGGGRADPNYTGISWTGWVTAVTELVAFVPVRTLSVVMDGTGGGAVASSPPGIDCGTTCTADYPDDTGVTLSASPSEGSIFTGWSGAGCSGPAVTCDVTMGDAENVTATFTLQRHTLTITTSGTGTGLVMSDAGGIACGATCSADYDHGTPVVLSAIPDEHVTFIGWSGGGCSGTDDCTVTMGGATSVNAEFDVDVALLTVTELGNGDGTVTDQGGGIDCPGVCRASYPQGSAVTLTADAGPHSTFTGWSGGGCSGTADCTVTLDAATSVSAEFDLVQHVLTLATEGNASGQVTSDDVGALDCPGVCDASYVHGTAVVLTTHAGPNAVFIGWGGECAGTGTTCDLTMDAARDATATFALVRHTLTVTEAGTGTGLVKSDLSGITCPGTCAHDYDHGTVVVLTATSTGGSTFAGWSGGGCAGTGTCPVTLAAATAVTASFNPPVLTTTLKDSDPAIAYDDWLNVADATANGGFYRIASAKNDTATWISPAATSITWVTRTGPAQGQASVTIDGKAKGVVDLYASVQASFSKVYAGLANKAHTVIIKVLHTKNPASSNYSVRLDAFVVGASPRRSPIRRSSTTRGRAPRRRWPPMARIAHRRPARPPSR